MLLLLSFVYCVQLTVLFGSLVFTYFKTSCPLLVVISKKQVHQNISENTICQVTK